MKIIIKIFIFNLLLIILAQKLANAERLAILNWETKAPESLDNASPVLSNESRLQVYRSQKDLGRSCKLPKIIYERYYDAYVSGNTETASNILEEHLDKHFPGWSDYEWRR